MCLTFAERNESRVFVAVMMILTFHLGIYIAYRKQHPNMKVDVQQPDNIHVGISSYFGDCSLDLTELRHLLLGHICEPL